MVVTPVHVDFTLDNLGAPVAADVSLADIGRAQRTNGAWTRVSLTLVGSSLTILNENFNASTAMYTMFFLAVGLAFSLITVGRLLMTFGFLEIGKFRVRNQLFLATSIIV